MSAFKKAFILETGTSSYFFSAAAKQTISDKTDENGINFHFMIIIIIYVTHQMKSHSFSETFFILIKTFQKYQ